MDNADTAGNTGHTPQNGGGGGDNVQHGPQQNKNVDKPSH